MAKSGLIILPNGVKHEPDELESQKVDRWAREAGRPAGGKGVYWCEYHKRLEKRHKLGPICESGMEELRALNKKYVREGVPLGNRIRGWDMVKRVVKTSRKPPAPPAILETSPKPFGRA